MATKTPAVKPKAKPVVKPKEKHHYFPKLLFFFGIFLVVVAVVDYTKYFSIDSRVIDAIILFAGLWIIKIAVAKGSYARRKDVLLKYLK
tara:strand:- start:574 stop:840 length:267 start_codon:yes stop_codon:yes gene_type:complete